MKKISLIIICAIALVFASCQKADTKDKNGNTPKDVVEKMYKLIQEGNYTAAADYCKIPDSVDIKIIEEYVKHDTALKGQVMHDTILTGKEWKNLVIYKMKHGSNTTLKDYKVIEEEISKTDPNNATVKTSITIIKDGKETKAECSFPMKRDSLWRIIG